MKEFIDVQELQKYIISKKQHEYYYILADGEIVTFEKDKNVFIPWCFIEEKDVIRFVNHFKSRDNSKHYQYIKTLEKIENWE
jgi:hypothetical protein